MRLEYLLLSLRNLPRLSILRDEECLIGCYLLLQLPFSFILSLDVEVDRARIGVVIRIELHSEDTRIRLELLLTQLLRLLLI